MIRRFERVEGRYIEKIPGQERLAFAMTDSNDLYDLVGWAERGGYPGSVILFYDLATGQVHQPFPKERDVLYGDPAYAGGRYWMLRADYTEKRVTLYRWVPGEEPEEAAAFSTEETDLYNLRLVGEPVHVISQNGERFSCYYPEKMSFPLEKNETVTLISDGKVYLEAWIEEGWDEEQDRASEDYRFYYRTVVKDREGNTLSSGTGSLFQAPDGTWWTA